MWGLSRNKANNWKYLGPLLSMISRMIRIKTLAPHDITWAEMRAAHH